MVVCTLHFARGAENVAFPGCVEWRKALEKDGTHDDVRQAVMEDLLYWIGQGFGEPIAQQMLMTVIRFVLPSENNRVKKMLHLFWENTASITRDDGSPPEELLLVCNAIRSDLQSSNEFVRASTCRMLCNINYLYVLEPLIDAVLENLDHRLPMVRRNAVMCVYAILREHGTDVIPGAVEKVELMIRTEGDPSTQRNCFILLMQVAPQLAIEYALSVQDVIMEMGSLFQLQYVRLLRRFYDNSPAATLHKLAKLTANASSQSVRYEATMTLLSLDARGASSSRIVAKSLMELFQSQSDGNVRKIVLNKITELVSSNRQVYQEHAIEILNCLAVTPSHENRQLLVSVLLRLNSQTSRTVIVPWCSMRILGMTDKTQLSEEDTQIMHVLLTLLGGYILSSAEIVPRKELTPVIANITSHNFASARLACWILNDYCLRHPTESSFLSKEIVGQLQRVRYASVMNACLSLIEISKLTDVATGDLINAVHERLKPFEVVLDDNTSMEDEYIIDSNEAKAERGPREDVVEMKNMTLVAKVISVIAEAMNRLSILGVNNIPVMNRGLQILTNIYTIVERSQFRGDLTPGRIVAQRALQIGLAAYQGSASVDDIGSEPNEKLVEKCGLLYKSILTLTEAQGRDGMETSRAGELGSVVAFSQIAAVGSGNVSGKSQGQYAVGDLELVVNGHKESSEKASRFMQRMLHVKPLTGYGDPIYAEVFFHLDGFDLRGEVLLINRTAKTLQNVTVDMRPGCKLKPVSVPEQVSLVPGKPTYVHCSFKCRQTDPGLLFGNIKYTDARGVLTQSIPFHEVHVNLLTESGDPGMDAVKFRECWTLFEWENKAKISSKYLSLSEYMEKFCEVTKMRIIEGQEEMGDSLPFVSLNLASKNRFDEVTLANVSLLVLEGGGVEGQMRLRARSDGIALTAGNAVEELQRSLVHGLPASVIGSS